MSTSRLLKELGTTLKAAVDSLQQELPPGRRTRNAQRTDTYKDESSSSSEESEHARGRSFRRSSSRPFASLAGAEPAQTRPRPRQTEVLSSSLMEARGGDASRPRRSGRQQTFVEDDQEVEPDQGSRRSLRHSADKAQSRGGDGGGSRVLRLQPGSKDGDQNESSGSESSEESESEEEEEEEGKKYSLRDRGGLKRETMNIQQLGGDGGAYKRSAGRQSRQDDRISYKDPQARIRLGGRISPPHYKRGSKRRRSGRGHRDRDRDGSGRRHFDSSSESSSGSEAGGWRGRSSLFSRDRKDQRGGAVSSGGGWGGFGGEEDQFSQHERHRQQRELDSIQPLMGGPPGMGMGGSVVDSTSRRDVAKADATPIGVDPSIGFHSVGGLDNHIRALKEMVVLPLLYPDVFARFDTQPPRGVLFVGPPGTGKTLTARALVNSLSVGTVAPAPDGKPTVVNWSNGKKVSFFMRKGADCLSKWVGEGERQLRLLFEQAKRFQPSIIFFDEIDGLAPVRSAKQDQIHASIVSTLLALMDGLDSRGQIVIIGATNRPDAVDPALRRPGRFDRELMFPLPDASARAAILDIHTATWNPPLPSSTKQWVVQSSVGYCGADLKALCAEACLISLRRTFPQVYESTQRLELDVSELNLGRGDFAAALQRVVPASRRSNSSPAAPLEPMAAALLQPFLDCIVDKLGEVFPGFLLKSDVAIKRKRLGAPLGSNEPKRADFSDMWISCLTDVLEEHTLRGLNGDHAECISTTSSACSSTLWSSNSIVSRPRLMVLGEYGGMGQAELSRATLHLLEQFPVFSLDFASLLADGGHFSPEQALVSRVLEAAKAAPSVLYLPDVTSWWRCASDSMRSALMSSAAGADRALPVLWLSTVASDAQACDDDPRLMWLLQWLSGAPGARSMGTFNSQAGQQQIDNLPTDGGVVRLERPSESARHELFESFFRQLLALPAIIFAARKKMMMSKKRKLTIAAAAPEKTLDNRSPNLVAVLHARPQGPVSLAELLHDQTPPPAQLPFIDIDEARNYMRELRLFMRAALAEMFKEKKLSPLFRPVDPELVPDYYDVITAPMDLDTIRTKVDEDMYPTYRCFYYDLEQIGFNATTYNPLDIKDFRGKQIVHAAKSLLDMVETHAYNFKDRLGYDLFKRCDVIASCPSVLRSVSDHSGQLDTPVFAKALDARVKAKADVKRVRAIMPRENETLYKEILAKHCALKEEMGEEHPSFGKAESQLQKLQEDISSYRNGNCGTSTDRRVSGKDFRANSIDSAVRRSTRGRGSEGGDWRSFFMALEVEEQSSNKRKRRNEVDDRDIGVGDVNNELEDLVENDLAEVQVVDTAKGEEATYLDKITMSNSAENVEDIAAESADEFEIDLEYDNLMQKLNEAMQAASEASFDCYVRAAVEASARWHYSEIMDCISALQKVCRDFQHSADWKGTIQDLNDDCSSV